MHNLIKIIVGDTTEKKRYRENKKRAKALPTEYAQAYRDIRNYLWNTSGILTIEPLISLVDLLEEAAAANRKITDITGPDVAAFADDFVRETYSYNDRQRKKLNDTFKNT